MFKEKYLKYKQKYLILKTQKANILRQTGGSNINNIIYNNIDYYNSPPINLSPRDQSPRDIPLRTPQPRDIPPNLSTPDRVDQIRVEGVDQFRDERLIYERPRRTRGPDSPLLNFPRFNLGEYPLDNGLFTCKAKFDEFIGKQREKKDIISRNNPKLIRFKNYSEIETVLSDGKLNCYSLLMQTILGLEQGLIDESLLVNHNFDVNFARQAGIDAGGLRREYLNLLSNEIKYIFTQKVNHNYLAVVLEMIYKSRCSLITDFNILHLFYYHFIVNNDNVIGLIESTQCSNVSFSELLLNFINYNFNQFEIFNTLEKINEILKKDNNVIVLLYLFGEYINQNQIPNNVDYFDSVLSLEKEDVLALWYNYKLEEDTKNLISEVNTNYPGYNLLQLHSHFQYNEDIDSEILISRIKFEGIDESLILKFKSIIRDYQSALDSYTGSDPETIRGNAEMKKTFGDQQEFLKHMLKYWSGSSYLNIEYKVNYNASITDLFHVHTCSYQIETKVLIDTSLYDLVYSLLIRISSEFNTAG